MIKKYKIKIKIKKIKITEILVKYSMKKEKLMNNNKKMTKKAKIKCKQVNLT